MSTFEYFRIAKYVHPSESVDGDRHSQKVA